ncbi:Actin-binding protein IPP [Eumeta japonica]|uniref:Kelch-like protein diablo n=1 Tax=Eumeta variegata TaxID=151549 RepID=A0A4C1XGM3_EUMVA|nr:Actin-binding protein IPP [Eumeta japonica]
MIVKAHRVVLAEDSAYFKAIFNSNFEECNKKTVSLPSIPPDILPLVVEFIYSGQTIISNSTVQHLMNAANILKLEGLAASCSDHFKTKLRPSTVLDIISFAEAHNYVDVFEEALTYARKHWKAIAEGDEILSVSSTLLIKLLSSDDLLVDEENQVLNVVLRWLEHDALSRRQHCVEVLRRVRLRLLKPHALENALANIRDPSIAEIVRAFIAVLESEINTKPRLIAECYFYVVGGLTRRSPTAIDKLATAVKFDVHLKKWKDIAPMSEARSMLGVATLGGLLYAVGGENNDKALASGEVYDPITDDWTPIASMKKARQCFGLAAVNKKLFAFGGIGDQLESSVEAYDPEADEWVVVGEMPEPRSDMSVATYGEAVYVVGGRTQIHGYTSDVLRYTPARAEWRRLRPLLLARAGAAAVATASVLGPSLYVVGGQSTEKLSATEMIDCYDLESEELNFASEMSTARVGCVACSVGDVLIVVGGDSGTDLSATTTASVETYDVAKVEWGAAPALPLPRAYAGAALI